jgi:uncharacterized Tic20 family protein
MIKPTTSTPTSSGDRGLAVVAQLSNFGCQIVLPLIVLAINQGRSPQVRASAVQALIVQAVFLAGMAVAGALGVVVGEIGFFAIFGLLGVYTVYLAVVTVLGVVHGARGLPYRYPFFGRWAGEA